MQSSSTGTAAPSSSSSSHSSAAEDAQQPHPFQQWVDYLPDDITKAKVCQKRVSLDLTETWLTQDESDSHMSDAMDWHDASSLEDPILPAVLLVEHDPLVQQELLLEHHTPNNHENDQVSLEDLMEQRRQQLAESMRKSRESRKYLENHIQQRANLASVLADIERSSRQVDGLLNQEEMELLKDAEELLPDLHEATS